MSKIRSLLLALIATLVVIPVVPVAADGVPITPAVSSCSASVLAFFDNRVCIDPTASGVRRVYIYTNNVLVASYVITASAGTGCTITPMSTAQFPFQVTPLTGGAAVGYFDVLVSDLSFTQCGGPAANRYKASSATVAAIAARVATHTLVHVY